MASIPSKTSSPGMVKFFVHHVNTPAESSPHIVNLKTVKTDLWEDVRSNAPEKAPDSLFHSYHVRAEGQTPPNDIASRRGRQTPPNLPLERGGSELENHSKLFSDLKHSKKFNNKPQLLNLAPILRQFSAIKNFAIIAIIMIGLVSVAPGSVRGYYEDVTSTQTTIVNNGTAGFLALQASIAALKSSDLATAGEATSDAILKFNLALHNLAEKHTILQTIASMLPFVNDELADRKKILLAGEEIAVGNSYLIATLQSFTDGPSTTLTYKLDHLSATLNATNPNYALAQKNLDAVDVKLLPFEYQQQFRNFHSLFGNLVTSFKSLPKLNDTLQEIFGGKGQRRYLVIFQNPAELRPTGGFMGSFAVLDVKDGQIINLFVPAGGAYDLNGQLSVSEIPPLPLTIVNKRWEFQDANWFPDFSASAKKILWFYNHSWNEKADGVITINSTVLERLLSVLGPVTDGVRNLNITAENANTVIQNEVENGPEKLQNKPKQILADLAPTILDSIKNTSAKNIIPLLGNLEEALSQKEIQAFFTDPAAENSILSSGWGGAIATVDDASDYLLVINTNLQGQKSDARIRQLISHEAVIQNDGSVIDNVVITREHTGLPDEKFYGVPNIDYLRVYVPNGSTLLSASGFTWPEEKSFRAPDPASIPDPFLKRQETELGIDRLSGTRITSEFGKTAFGNWVVTEPGNVSRVEFSYRLPFKIDLMVPDKTSLLDEILKDFKTAVMPYRLTAQKQSGITSDFESQIIFPPVWQPSWLEGAHATPASNGFKVERFQLTTDETWTVLLKQNI